MMSVDALDLPGGHKMPLVGLGTWQSKPGEVTEAVKEAIDVGYRHIDCAYYYDNERKVGAGIKAKVEEGVVTRGQLFIVSKLWNTRHRAEDVRPSLMESLESLGLDYLDLYLIHWPMALEPGTEMSSGIFTDVSHTDTWQALEKCVDEGLVKHIGLSNFNSQQIQNILDNCRIKPANVQIEIHPYLSQTKLVDFCQSRGITVTAYSPLGSPDRPKAWAAHIDEPPVLDDPTLGSVARKLKKSPAQIVLRWLVQRQIVVIPKSVTPLRIRENFAIFDFNLGDEDMETMFSLNKDMRMIEGVTRNEKGIEVWTNSAAPHFPFLVEF